MVQLIVCIYKSAYIILTDMRVVVLSIVMQVCSVHLSAPTSTAVREQTGPKCAACKYCRHVVPCDYKQEHIIMLYSESYIMCITHSTVYTVCTLPYWTATLLLCESLWLLMSFENV